MNRRTLCLVMMLAAGVVPAKGSVYYWVGAANANWSASGSWAATSGGAGGAGVPGASDDVIFDAGGVSNAVVDAAFSGTVYSVTVGPAIPARTRRPAT